MPEPLDLGFSEFVAKLISETFTAVAEAALDQEHRYAQLAAAAAMPLEQFAEQYVDPADVDEALLALFPPTAEGRTTGESSAARGQPYTAATDSEPEQPPLLERLGLEVSRSEVQSGRIGPKLEGRIRQAVAERVGREQWEVARAVVQRGVPRVMVDAGHITAKQTYQVSAASDQPPEAASPRTAVPRARVGDERLRSLTASPGMTRLLRSTIRPDLVLTISSPKSNGPVSQQDIYGEVEIRFKTVP